MTQELSGRVAIVTGAGRNIGRGIALALADAGAAVVVNARPNLQEAEAFARELPRRGGGAAKAGRVGFTRGLAHELARDKIRVNTVTPGLMAAPRPAGQPVPQHHSLVQALVGRRGEPSDIAAAVRFLCGPGASFITGQNIQVNGGTFFG